MKQYKELEFDSIDEIIEFFKEKGIKFYLIQNSQVNIECLDDSVIICKSSQINIEEAHDLEFGQVIESEINIE